MKILHIAPIGHIAEGIGTVLNRLVPEQQKLGHDVKVVSVKKNVLYDIEVITITKEHIFSDFTDKWRPDIVVFHSVFFLPYLKFVNLLNAKQVPYLIQLHGGLSKENYKKGKLKKFVALQFGFKYFIRHAQSIIYLNTNEYNNSIVKDFNLNSTILPNGCENVTNICVEKSLDSKVDIVYIGRIDMVHKGNDKLLEALEILSREGEQNFKLSVYANPSDPDLTVFKNAIANKLELVEYKGPIYGKEKEDRLRKADIFLLTSRYEGMPMGVLEALSYGIPCLVTPGTNMTDVIDKFKAGWVVDFDASKIAHTLKVATNDYISNSQRYRRSARELSQQYNWEVIAATSINLFNKILLTTSNEK